MRENSLASACAIACSGSDAPVEAPGAENVYELFRVMVNVTNTRSAFSDVNDADQLTALITRATNAYCELLADEAFSEIISPRNDVGFSPSSIIDFLISNVNDKMHESSSDNDVNFSLIDAVKDVAFSMKASIVLSLIHI